MFGFLKKKGTPKHKAIRDQFEQHIAELRNSDETTQAVVGGAINMANSFFAQSYSSIEEFTALSDEEKAAFIDKLTGMKDKLSQADNHTGLGFGLFGMWVAALATQDKELIKDFTDELACYSRKARLSP